ncbi:MAG: hypothetical protein JWQ76_2297, partial [Ramlibacter sp.]|nr:hypothetical protein [Ramlibacter sp.]
LSDAQIRAAVLAGTPLDDSIAAMNGSDVIAAGAGDDVVYGGNGNDTITGDDGADQLYGDAGNDVLSGGGSGDQIYGGAGNDTLDGGTGNDLLQGGQGSDTYLFGRGDGRDTLRNSPVDGTDPNSTAYNANGNMETDQASTTDVLRFKDGIAAADLGFTRYGAHLVIAIQGTGDQIVVEGFFAQGDVNHGFGPDRIEFFDGTVLSDAQIRAAILTGTAGDDTIASLNSSDVIPAGAGDDLVYGGGGNDQVTGGAGADLLFGEAGNDTLDGGEGSDVLRGGLGSDTYLFGRGDGGDIVRNHNDASGSGTLNTANASSYYRESDQATATDILRFKAGIQPADLRITREGTSLVIGIRHTTDQVVIEGMFFGNTINHELGVDRIEFADGTLLSDTNIWALLQTSALADGVILGIASLGATPATGLQTGQDLTLTWATENRGIVPTDMVWNDRITVVNVDTGVTLSTTTVPYNGASADGSIPPGEQRTRSYTLRLPNGSAAAGNLRISVTVDADNPAGSGVLANNRASVDRTVVLAPYADLVVANLTLLPSADFGPGQSVTVRWDTVNQGTRAVTEQWADRLTVVNTTTNTVVYTGTVSGAVAGAGLLTGASASRSLQFTWPTGAAGTGNFEFRVLADSSNQVSELDAAGLAELNNQTIASRSNGPDLQVRQLRVQDPETLQAGGLVTIHWQDYNGGATPVPAGYNDRIVVRSAATQAVLFDTSIPVSALTDAGTLLASGEAQNRVFTFRLPEGLAGAGAIEITVTADQGSNGLGALYETNAGGTAETNNSAAAQATSATRAYADLVAGAVGAPAAAVSGRQLTLTWTVSNQGSVATGSQWNDHLILSRDAILGNADDVVLASVRHTGALNSGQSYAGSSIVTLPVLADGNYWFGVRADASQEVLEPDTRADNTSATTLVTLAAPITDLSLESVQAPTSIQSGEEMLVSWVVRNAGNASTDSYGWGDKVVISTSATPGVGETVLAPAVMHYGVVQKGDTYSAQIRVAVPRELEGSFYVRVYANASNGLAENGGTANNVRAAAAQLQVTLAPAADLRVSDVSAPTQAVPGERAVIQYTAQNAGTTATEGAWRDLVYLKAANGTLTQVGEVWQTAALATGASAVRVVSVLVPASLADGDYQWLVRTDASNTVYERSNEGNNDAIAAGTVRVAASDLYVTEVQGASTIVSAQPLTVSWRVANVGGRIDGAWVDQVYLSRNGVARLFAEVPRTATLATGDSYQASATFEVPIDFTGDYDIVVVTNPSYALGERITANNRATRALGVQLAAYADLKVTAVQVTPLLVADPAYLEFQYTVANQGTGAGRTSQWTDKVVLSADGIIGNSDDIVVAQLAHDGAVLEGTQYTRSERIQLPVGTTGRYRLYVISDAANAVFENGLEANNSGQAANQTDIMPIAYSDLRVESAAAEGQAQSGRPLRFTWTVANRGMESTNTESWSDSIWLSRNPDGTNVVTSFGSAGHLGQLAVGQGYTRSVDVVLPEGIQGDFYLNVKTGGPFEFIYTGNNQGSTAAIPVTLSQSPDLIVEAAGLPATAQEGSLIEVSWSVLNQGQARAEGMWTDNLVLVPASGTGASIFLGSFTYDRGLDAGIRYTRTELVRLPARLEGLYRLAVATNANLGVYEYGAARNNNGFTTTAATQVSLNDRPDLRVGTVTVPTHVIAGGSAAIKYTVTNQGSTATSGRWVERVYLSLDGNLSGDDILVGRYDNASSLAPTEAYSNESASVDIPIRYRGDAYLIVVADAEGRIDEYPNEGNNVKAARLTIDAVPFGDLVTSNVVAPDQAVHGSSIEVSYKVANKGSAATRGEAASRTSWTDTVWLTRDRTRPGKGGDVKLAEFTHTGLLAVGEDYLNTVQVNLPSGLGSGQYFITVWSDAYDVILEDTLATNLNPDDPNQVDNNNYKARPISILGITPPDLAITALTAAATASADAPLSFTYTVQNKGDAFGGRWTDSVFLADTNDLGTASKIWTLGSWEQSRTLGNGESYTATQSVQFGPSVEGLFLIVKTDAWPWSYNYNGAIGELSEANNARATATTVTPKPSDLRVTNVTTQASNFSGEETLVTWTVTNDGAAVWGGTLGWMDGIYISKDPTFIPQRASLIGTAVHANTTGLASGASYTANATVRLPEGADGQYYIYVITDLSHSGDGLAIGPAGSPPLASGELRLRGDGAASARLYSNDVYEDLRNDNNMGTAPLGITYREADLVVQNIQLSQPDPASGTPLTVTWTVRNDGTRATRTTGWLDGVYLSRDASLDNSDEPLVDRGSDIESYWRVRQTSLPAIVLPNGQRAPHYLQPGESYTNTATFNLPDSVSGSFYIIVKADTQLLRDPYGQTASTIRDGLPVIDRVTADAVHEFAKEGNNATSAPLTIVAVTPPDLQVTAVTAADHVIAGQTFTLNYTVSNQGGNTPSDQLRWNDLIYLSKDRFLDVNQDRYVGYLGHSGGLAAGGSYSGQYTVTAPRDLVGPYYVFVVTDPARAWGKGDFGDVREFGKDQNNATAAAQPILIDTPPPADLKVTNVVVPAQGTVGTQVEITYTVLNDSDNPAQGRWTDALYLSSDNAWDLGDKLLGKVDRTAGDLAGHASYTAKLMAALPPLKDGSWRIIVRPDLYNDVYEGAISYTATGLNMAPGEANNRIASGSTIQVTVPLLQVASPQATTLSAGDVRLYKLTVAAGETLRVSLDSSAAEGANEVYIRYGDIPTSYAYDAAYGNPVAADQQAVIPSTVAGDYYVLVRSRQTAANTPVAVRADLLPLMITGVTPDNGGTGDDEHRWVTVDITGARFKSGALVKLARPGVAEIEPARWQVLDATHIRAVFDLRTAPRGLYDLTVINPDGSSVTEPYRYLVERGIEADVTIGIGGPRNMEPGDLGTYSVSLQSLTNVDTPYVRFDIGAPNMGSSLDVLEGLSLPYLVFGSNVGGQPDGHTVDAAGNTMAYGQTPTQLTDASGAVRNDIPWASLDGQLNTSGFNLTPGYAFDLAGGGFAGATFNVQTYPGLAEWIAHDFEGLRDKLYMVRPDWKAQGLLDGGVADLNKIQPGLAAKFLSDEPDDHITKKEALAMPFRFNVLGAATPLTRDEFIADQRAHAERLRNAILADDAAPPSLRVLAADAEQWAQGWLGALETAGLLRPVDEAPPIRNGAKVVSLNATLATGILLSKAGESYRTQADILGFFAQVQKWYGDTAAYAGDRNAVKAAIDHYEYRYDADGTEVQVPVPVLANPADYDLGAAGDTHFINFNIFAGGVAEQEYIAGLGITQQALNLTQYLQQAAASNALASVLGPQGNVGADGAGYVPADVALPYTISFKNPSAGPAGQLRIVTELDADLDPRSLRLGDLKLGDINVHIPPGRANFQGDFDFSGSKGFILRVSAGVDAENRIATWLLQAIDPDTGEVLHDAARGLLAPPADPSQAASSKLLEGFVSYTVMASQDSDADAVITASARVFLDDAPPTESASTSVKLDRAAPATVLSATSLGNSGQGLPQYKVQWTGSDDVSGVKHVTVYVAQNGGDFRIWLRQAPASQNQAIFTGEAGSTYEFLAVATDYAGNREAASVANAVLPDDGSRQALLDSLGATESLDQTPELPAATPGRTYADNALFAQAKNQLPGFVATSQTPDLQSVVAPLTLRGFAEGFASSAADIGALAMVQLPDGTLLVSAGTRRNEVFAYGKDGGRSTVPLFTLDQPVLDMAVDAVGQLWVLTGHELLQVDAGSGAILRRLQGPGQQELTHALAINAATGEIYVSSGSGIEVFKPGEANEGRAWRHFSNEQVGDLAFGPDGRLWGVRWTGSRIAGADAAATTDIVSFPMSGRTIGRAELEYRINGLVDSIAFGRAGTALDGLLIATTNVRQRPVNSANDVPHQTSVWGIALKTREVLQLARGGTRGESILATADGRILVAQTGRVDEIAPVQAPKVQFVSVADGALVPLPLGAIAVRFDQAMWTGAANADEAARTNDVGSVLNPANFTLHGVGLNAGAVHVPMAVQWNAATRSVLVSTAGLPAGQWELEVSSTLRNFAELRLAQAYVTGFTAVVDMSHQIALSFSNTRGDRATGEISYDIDVKNIGTDDIRGPLTLVLDPLRAFGSAIVGGQAGSGGQSELWVLDLTAGLQAFGNKLPAGATLLGQTVTIRPLSSASAGLAALVKAEFGHGIYAIPLENAPPALGVAIMEPGAAASAEPVGTDMGSTTLPDAAVGQPWSARLTAIDTDGVRMFWQLVSAPPGLTLTPLAGYETEADGYYHGAVLNWTPTARDPAATEIVVRVQDSRGGVDTRRFQVSLAGGNRAPVIASVSDIVLAEGEALQLPLVASDADGTTVTLTVDRLPPGASFDARTGMLTWVPGYDQAGSYEGVTVVASDGITTVREQFTLTVLQGYARPVLAPAAAQTLRQGDAYALQLAGSLPGASQAGGPNWQQADGSTVVLEYTAGWLPAGATLNSETGWFAWTPGFIQQGEFRVPITLVASYPGDDGEEIVTRTTREFVFSVVNANGAPEFDAGVDAPWQVLEGQPLRVTVFAYDPDNPDFEPRIRFTPTSPAAGPATTAPTVSYQVQGLPAGASFDAETLEIVWTPGYAQAGTYYVTVTATDDGNGTGVPAHSTVTVPIVVSNANRAPLVGDIANAFVDRGAELEIPVVALDEDGNPLQVTVAGLPHFATYTQVESANGQVHGVIRFAPGAQDRGDYAITVTAIDNGDGDVNQVQAHARSFVLTVRSASEAPVVTVPVRVAAVAGQALSVPILVGDLDQDALTITAEGLPSGATIQFDAQYGHAVLVWTPMAGDVGTHDIVIVATDSGLPPADSGYPVPSNPVPNVTRQSLRLVVSASNAAPELLAAQVNGASVAAGGAVLAVASQEGAPLSLELFARDPDSDLLTWTVAGLPPGMALSLDATGARATLQWTPGAFAAQGNNLLNGSGAIDPINNGLYRVQLVASDGSAFFTRTIDITVANTNQAPRLLPLPLQLVSEGDTIGFVVRPVDADGDALRLALVYDGTTPAGVLFDPNTGYFEWTPTQEVVNNSALSNQPFTFAFTASDGQATATQTVQVRVFDVNRAPRVVASNHALVVGQAFSLPVTLGTSGPAGLAVSDPDGTAQTQALAIGFTGLPAGASYDAATRKLSWVPGPGQVGDFVVTAVVADTAVQGALTTRQSFVLRVAADASALAPTITVSTTPSGPALPGQLVVATVRAESFAAMGSIVVHVRGLDAAQPGAWQPVALDAAGRMRFTPLAAGLVDIRVTATDVDGFSATEIHRVRVKDPADLAGPALTWVGALQGAGVALTNVSDLTAVQVRIEEQQLMGWRLQIAPAAGGFWTTLGGHDSDAVASNGIVTAATLDPDSFANGVYTLRLSAWDLAGRLQEIEARIVIDSAAKDAPQASVSDQAYALGGHPFSLTRVLDAGTPADLFDLGNWRMAGLDTALTHDQLPPTGDLVDDAWRTGARVWLQAPGAVAGTPLNLRFTLGVTSERLGDAPGAPVILRPIFSSTVPGWSLVAHAASSGPEALIRQGQRLYLQSGDAEGMPWVPQGYTLTGPDGTSYALDAQGKVTAVAFTDGVRWMVGNGGIAAIRADGSAAERIDFLRDSDGRIIRVSATQGTPVAAVAYRYDTLGRLELARHLDDTGTGSPYGYDSAGSLLTALLAANLGAAVNWTAPTVNGNTPGAWSGTLGQGVA